MRDRENEIVALVTYIHNKIGYRDPPFSFQEFCANFPAYELQPAELPSGFNGEILVKGPYKIIRYRSRSSTRSSRFAIGHEIGHGFLHNYEDFQCSVNKSISIFKMPSKDPREWEADCFSAELLMPFPFLNRMATGLNDGAPENIDLESGRLSKIFGVTKTAMKTRLRDLVRLREWEGEYL